MPIKHKKTNAIASWTQNDLDAAITKGQFPSGTKIADIVLSADWNDDHTAPAVSDVTGLQTALDAKTTAPAQIEVTGATVTLAPNTIYIMNRATVITATLPAAIAQFASIQIIGKGAGGWKINQNANQVIRLTATSTTVGTGGSVASGSQYDNVVLRCITTNTEFSATARNGALVVV